MRGLRKPEQMVWGALSLLVALIILRLMLVTTARFAPQPLGNFARQAGHLADPGNI